MNSSVPEGIYAFPNPLSDFLSSSSWTTFIIPTLILYIALCQTLRFRREHAFRKKMGYPDRASLARMTSVEAQAIIKFMATWEIPLSHFLSLEFGLFKTYAVESIARLLLATRNLTDPERSPRR
ncbi:hypothetical protein F5Y04DRAFT_103279 [Hypomontagnella monticulosa]|nr:hypothetical protein F5Y04DRAFT_103279 [Hypomontagnella monticulosa]